ncbi:hypothetical protein WKI68_28215 [Streptomyces sp. MS1.HAVA.3]|uniref:Uncharacterized protein n=1 Tax=Streptomyces caledonius TaxID=3134107 RepID=A0ABU8U8F7_9ACTN
MLLDAGPGLRAAVEALLDGNPSHAQLREFVKNTQHELRDTDNRVLILSMLSGTPGRSSRRPPSPRSRARPRTAPRSSRPASTRRAPRTRPPRTRPRTGPPVRATARAPAPAPAPTAPRRSCPRAPAVTALVPATAT